MIVCVTRLAPMEQLLLLRTLSIERAYRSCSSRRGTSRSHTSSADAIFDRGGIADRIPSRYEINDDPRREVGGRGREAGSAFPDLCQRRDRLEPFNRRFSGVNYFVLAE